jgi:ribosomal protein S18 acetylase RimI-like enzyme
MPIRYAVVEEHREILGVAKQSKYTRDYSNMIFSSTQNYENNDTAIYTLRNKIIAFTNYRHLVRKPTTTLYFIGVDKEHQSKGLGEKLLHWAVTNSPHKHLTFKVSKDNEGAIKFYQRIGAEILDEGAFKSGEEYFIFQKG